MCWTLLQPELWLSQRAKRESGTPPDDEPVTPALVLLQTLSNTSPLFLDRLESIDLLEERAEAD